MAEGDFVDEGGGSFSRLVRISSCNSDIPISITNSLTRQLGMVRITDNGTEYVEILDSNGANIGTTRQALVVINLNYVWDAGNTRWEPMTQP